MSEPVPPTRAGADAGPEPGAPLRTHPLGLIVGGLGALPNLVIPAGLGLYGLARGGDGFAVGAAVLLAVGLAVAGPLLAASRWRRFTYRVGPQDIRVESGLLSRSARSVPYDRIQDVSLEQSALARIFGLVAVRFETGAGGKDELTLAYLALPRGQALRDLVRARRDGGAVPGAEETPAAPAREAARPLFAMGPRRVLTFGLFEFSLVIVAVLVGVVQQFDFLLPGNVWDMRAVWHLAEGPGSRIAQLGLAAQVAGGIVVALALGLVGLVTGVARTALREWDFRLEETPRGFRRRRGLLTRTDVVMPVHRVQALALSTGIVRRRLDWHGLAFISLASDAGAANHSVAPFAHLAEIAPVARAAGFALPDPPAPDFRAPGSRAPGSDAESAAEPLIWHRTSAHYHAMRAVVGLVAIAVVTVASLIALRLAGDAPDWAGGALVAIAAALMALEAARRAMRWHHDRFALGPRQIYRRHGWLAPDLLIGDRVKQQSAQIVQGPWGRRQGYATLELGLAGGRFAITGLPLAQAHRLRDGVLASVAGADFSELI